MSLIEAFTTTRDGQKVEPTPEAIAKYVAKTYLGTQGDPGDKPVTNVHQERRKKAAERLRLYRDDYIQDIHALIDIIWDHPQNRADRKKIAELAMPMSLLARIAEETSPVYDKPAVRAYETEPKTEQLRTLEDELELHDLLQEAHRLTTALNEVFLWGAPVGGLERKTLRIVTPDAFDIIPDPRDHLTIAGVLLDTAPTVFGEGVDASKLQHFELWDDKSVYRLDQSGALIGQPEPHTLGRIPGVLTHRKKPTDCLLDATSGRDMVGAHKAVAFLNLCIIRLAFSQGENQPVLKGILARVAAGQRFDGQTPIALPPEVTMEMLQTKTDPEHFLSAIKHYVGSVAQRYGMSYEQFTFQETADTTSGRAYQVRREKLTEIRNQQKKRWWRVERELMDLFGLGRAGYTSDFAELAVPQDAGEEVDLLDKKMRIGLDNPVAYLQRKNPELSAPAAAKLLKENLTITQKVWDMARAMQTPANADGQNPGKTAQANGADNQGDGKTPAVAGGKPRDLRAIARRALQEVA